MIYNENNNVFNQLRQDIGSGVFDDLFSDKIITFATYATRDDEELGVKLTVGYIQKGRPITEPEREMIFTLGQKNIDPGHLDYRDESNDVRFKLRDHDYGVRFSDKRVVLISPELPERDESFNPLRDIVSRLENYDNSLNIDDSSNEHIETEDFEAVAKKKADEIWRSGE